MTKPQPNSLKIVITEEFVKIISEVLKFFKGNIKQTRIWMISPNYNFGGVPPLKLMMMGRAHKVLKFIEEAIAKEITEDVAKDKCKPTHIMDGVKVAREWTLMGAERADGSTVFWLADGPEALGETIRVREIL